MLYKLKHLSKYPIKDDKLFAFTFAVSGKRDEYPEKYTYLNRY